MNILIFKTDINSDYDFGRIKYSLNESYNLNNCTVDLEDKDKVLRVIGKNIEIDEVKNRVNNLGFFREELDD